MRMGRESSFRNEMKRLKVGTIWRVDRGEFKLGLVYDLFKVIGFMGEFIVGFFIEFPSILWKIYPEELEEIKGKLNEKI